MKLCSWTCAGAVTLALAASACGDPETTDNRGYTKAPLEDPSVLIAGETPSDMSRYGSPNRVVVEELTLPEETIPEPAQTAQTTPVTLPEGVTEAMVAAGGQIFAGPGTCFACHGAAGAGTPLAPALNDATWLNIDGAYDAIVSVVSEGVATPKEAAVPMPPRGGAALTDLQVREVAAYVYSISR
jgi:mono/diheme cytochrome c family protein